MRIAVIIPTYNERLSLGALVDAIFAQAPTMPQHEFHIVVVDGNSTDGTAELVKEKQTTYPQQLHLIEESKKEGLGMAYIKGMNHAVSVLHADAYIEFDGDGQHEPRFIHDLVRSFDEGNDYVIGSRYVNGIENF